MKRKVGILLALAEGILLLIVTLVIWPWAVFMDWPQWHETWVTNWKEREYFESSEQESHAPRPRN